MNMKMMKKTGGCWIAFALMLSAHADVAVPDAATPPDTRALLSDYVRRFNARDNEVWTNAIPNAASEEFLQKNIPRFACPDKDIERTYYFRWWTFRKHLRKSSSGRWCVTEFLPDVRWAGKENTIVCPAGHHFREGRWLRDPVYVADLARFWLADPGTTHRWAYSSWLYTGTCLFAEVAGCDGLPVELLDAAADYYRGWEKGFHWSAAKLPYGGDGKGGFLSVDDREGTEVSLGGHGYKPLLSSAMWSEANAIATVARKAGRADLVAEFEAKARTNLASFVAHCWNEELGFFTTGPAAGGKGTVRELHGYAPWYFGVPTGKSPDWSQLSDTNGFAACHSLSFPERRAPGFAVDYAGHPCKWNGPSWPFATSIALTAFSNELHRRRTEEQRRLYVSLLHQYAAAQQRRDERTREMVPWIDENLHPDKPEWITRRIFFERLKERPENTRRESLGKDYNHSTFCDLVIDGLVGFRANGTKGFTVDPLFPAEWDYLVLDDLRYRGHDVGIRWQRGKGLSVSVDGRVKASADGVRPVSVGL